MPMTKPDMKVKEFTAGATRSSPRFRPSPRLNPALLRVPRGRLSSMVVVGAASGTPSRACPSRALDPQAGGRAQSGHLPAIVVAKGFCTP
jgi:hypothetical protein